MHLSPLPLVRFGDGNSNGAQGGGVQPTRDGKKQPPATGGATRTTVPVSPDQPGAPEYTPRRKTKPPLGTTFAGLNLNA